MSVYGSREGSPDNDSPRSTTDSTSTGKQACDKPSPDKPVPLVSTQQVEDTSPPPLPTPLAQSSPETEKVDSDGRERDVADGDSGDREVRDTSGTGSAGGTGGRVAEDHLQFSTANSTDGGTGLRAEGTRETAECHNNRRPSVVTGDGREGERDEKQHSSDYHTPSSISDEELKVTTDDIDGGGRGVTAATHAREESSWKRLAVEGSGEGREFFTVTEGECEVEEEEEERTDGVIFQPHQFAPIPAKFGVSGGGVVAKPKPHPSTPGKLAAAAVVDDAKPRFTSGFAVPEPIVSSARDDVSLVSSAASSFRETSQNMTKDYSSLSLDRHSDIEGSVVEVRGHKGPGGGGGLADGEGLQWRVGQMLKKGEDDSYLLPVSSSPMDIVTMLTRLACFTRTLLNTLTPKLRHGAVPGLDEPRVSPPLPIASGHIHCSLEYLFIMYMYIYTQRAHDYAPDVAMAKRQASQQLKHVENTHAEFLKKLHKVAHIYHLSLSLLLLLLHTDTHTHTQTHIQLLYVDMH